MNFGLSKQTLSLIFNYFAKNKNIKLVKIFGSRALGTYKKSSDIDLVFYNFNPEKTGKLASDLNELPTPYKFDIIIYEEIKDSSLKEHIDKFSKDFYEQKQPNICL